MVRDEMEADKWGTVEALAKAGYHGLEGTIDHGANKAEWEETRKRMNDLGMEVAGIGCRHSRDAEIDEAIEKARVLGCELIMTYWGPAESEDQLKRDAEVLESMAGKCSQAGLKYCYHNHEHEFATKFGKGGNTYAIDILMEHAPHLYLELDVAWCRFGGTDPVQFIRQRGDRIPIIHVKDLWDLNVRGRFTSVGTGQVDCYASIDAAAAKGTQWVVVEQDRPNNLTHFESAIAAIYNLREAGLVPGR